MTERAYTVSESVIWKYELRPAHHNRITMPAGAKVLAVMVQNGSPHIWAMVDPAERPVDRVFQTYGTGHKLRPGIVYVGSFLTDGGAFVGHVFEELQ